MSCAQQRSSIVAHLTKWIREPHRQSQYSPSSSIVYVTARSTGAALEALASTRRPDTRRASRAPRHTGAGSTGTTADRDEVVAGSPPRPATLGRARKAMVVIDGAKINA